MTPLLLAQTLAKSSDYADRVLGVGIITRGLTDDDPVTHRMGWPLNYATIVMAANYVGLEVDDQFVDDVILSCGTISNALLNRPEDV